MILAILADFSKKLARNLVNSKKVPTFALLLRGNPTELLRKAASPPSELPKEIR
jgi:hypothetical protein